ncbi:MAG TPA: IPT/TIG domain-containing protein [Bryobacteraceae bacterium]|nr:IPT/TIG domain-containing protein [Bryobacteraceae bacterium]
MTMRHFFLPLAVGVVSTCAWAQQYTISTFAGNTTAGFSGDGGAATSAELSSPDGLTFDSSGNLYIADSANQRVRKISSGTISTVAGNGTAGYSGDKASGVTGTATDAEMLGPSGVSFDSSGNLYIADTGNHVIRMVTSAGIISTIAGDNTGGYAGDGAAATLAELEFPGATAVDSSGNIYIADSGNAAIREIIAGTINTLFGPGNGSLLFDPESLLLDGQGNLYVCDGDGLRVLKFNLTTKVETVVAGNGNDGFSGDYGPATDAELSDPRSIALDSKGNLYIADTNNQRIRKVYPDGTIATIAGFGLPGYFGDGGPASNALLSAPHGVAVDASGNVYVSDTENNVIRLLTPVSPSITSGGVVNAASFTAQVSPGSLATIFGKNFTGTLLSAGASLPLPASLGGISVTVNGKTAPVLYVNTSQINFQIPWETSTGTAAIVVSSGGIASPAVNVTVVAAAPGLFVQGSHAIVQNFPDFSLNSSGNPAKVGSTIIAYFTGGGKVSPAVADGAAAGDNPVSTVVSSVTATIGGQSATVSSASLAPGFVGLWQANITVPTVATAGDYPLILSAEGQSSAAANVSVTP